MLHIRDVLFKKAFRMFYDFYVLFRDNTKIWDNFQGTHIHILTDIQGCFRASAAVIRLDGLIVNILLMRSFASGVTVSHSGDGNYKSKGSKCLIAVGSYDVLRTP